MIIIYDYLSQEAQTILALQNVQTPLIGGMNTPLMNTDFSGEDGDCSLEFSLL